MTSRVRPVLNNYYGRETETEICFWCKTWEKKLPEVAVESKTRGPLGPWVAHLSTKVLSVLPQSQHLNNAGKGSLHNTQQEISEASHSRISFREKRLFM